MIQSRHDYDEVYRTRTWAYSDKPDPQLIKALAGHPRGRALDVGGGQGRHALALSALGYDVEIVDSAAVGLHQASEAAGEAGLRLRVLNQDASSYAPEKGLQVAVAALFFHIPSRNASMKVASSVGDALDEGGLFYMSVPGYTKDTEELLTELIQAAGCETSWLVKHLVTKKERPRLPVPRRNETRALAVKT